MEERYLNKVKAHISWDVLFPILVGKKKGTDFNDSSD